MRIVVKCCTPGCHRRKNISQNEREILRRESEHTGQRAGLICPVCVKRAFDNPDEYDLDIPLGELVVEDAKATLQWRLCFTPEGL